MGLPFFGMTLGKLPLTLSPNPLPMPLFTRIAFLALTLVLPLQAQFGDDASASSKASIHLDAESIAPGSSFTVALKLEHPEGWHSYYLNTGGLELPPSIEWTLPAGFKADPIQWPTPEVKDGYFGKSFVYTGSPIFLTRITTTEQIVAGSVAKLNAKASWQICKESCINEEAAFTIEIPVGDRLVPLVNTAELFANARAKIPAIPEGWNYAATATASHVTLHIELPAPLDSPPSDFIPNQPHLQSASSGGTIATDGNTLTITLKRVTENAIGDAIPQLDFFSGILLEKTTCATPEIKFITESLPGKSSTTPTKPAAMLPILFGMFLGGLILNLMPCVFPVIGLKIMGFVQQAGSDRKKIILHGIIFTLGVLASFAVLSGILFAARGAASGETISWGYQLQNPWVVLSLMVLMLLLGLNMFGVFEIGASATSIGGSLQTQQRLSGSFFSGVLATVVATPCSAPFLGAAIGAAIALPAIPFFTAFGAMALGLSAPYLLLSIFPKLIDLLPRPGAWMESFKQAMSFLLFATAGYLLWVYAGLIDLDNLLNPIFGLSAIAIAAWIHGRWNLPHRPRRTRSIALSLTVAFAIAGIYLAKPPKPSTLEWQTWSPEKVEALLADGKPVYIDFTAKWCATCQVNKKRAYNEKVIELMKDKGVVALKADKTKPNPEIDKAIATYGRAAIPVNVLLSPGKDPVILPELLSADDVIKAIEGL